MNKIIIFGIGMYFFNRKKIIEESGQIIAFIDNNEEIHNTFYEDKPIYHPNEIKKLEYDSIVLMSTQSIYMKQQLMKMGIDIKKIKFFEEYMAENNVVEIKFYNSNKKIENSKKKILIISVSLDNDGISIAVIRCAEILRKNGVNVSVAAPRGDENVIDELLKNGIDVVITPLLYKPNYFQMQWAYDYDLFIVNSTRMLLCVNELTNYKKVLWWLHDPPYVIEDESQKYLLDIKNLDNVQICAVSNKAKAAFNRYYPDIKEVGILPYGIPEKKHIRDKKKIINNKKMIFAIIGWVSPIKGQDILLDALNYLDVHEKGKIEIWIIGRINQEKGYGKRIQETALKNENVKVMGEINREDMDSIYSWIDVVVSASREDMLPTVIAEGMMNNKLCIISDATGIIDYVKDEEDAIIFESENVKDLANKIRWVIRNQEKCMEIKKKGRLIYEQLFSSVAFYERVKRFL